MKIVYTGYKYIYWIYQYILVYTIIHSIYWCIGYTSIYLYIPSFIFHKVQELGDSAMGQFR
jgi:hypothetical protein